jgi:hypothetical protein
MELRKEMGKSLGIMKKQQGFFQANTLVFHQRLHHLSGDVFLP